jgi:hypothetical protein
MTEISPSIPQVDQRLVWLDGLSRAGATVVVLVLLFSVLRVGLPPANTTPLEIEKSWVWSRPAQNFDSMYGSQRDR